MTNLDSKVMYREIQRFSESKITYIVIPIVIIPVIASILPLFNLENDSVDLMTHLVKIISLVVLIFVVALFWVLKLELYLTKDSINFRFFPMQIKMKQIKYEEIESYEVRQYSPIFEYGGWGIRYAFSKGWAYNVRGNMGMQIVLKNKKQILFGTQKSDEFYSVLNKLLIK
jgi:hypothetical protein